MICKLVPYNSGLLQSVFMMVLSETFALLKIKGEIANCCTITGPGSWYFRACNTSELVELC